MKKNEKNKRNQKENPIFERVLYQEKLIKKSIRKRELNLKIKFIVFHKEKKYFHITRTLNFRKN